MSMNSLGISTASSGSGSDNSDYLRPKGAAQYTGLSESTLAKLRMRHRRAEGPSFIRAGGSVIYRRCELDRWLLSLAVEA